MWGKVPGGKPSNGEGEWGCAGASEPTEREINIGGAKKGVSFKDLRNPHTSGGQMQGGKKDYPSP